MRRPSFSSFVLSVLAVLWVLVPTGPAFAAAPPAISAKSFEEIAAQHAGSESERLRELFDLAWAYRLQESPELATEVGAPGENDRWGDVSQAATERRHETHRKILAAAESIDRSKLTDPERLDFDLLHNRLQRDVEGYRFPGELLAINQRNGIQQEVPHLLDIAPAATLRDYDALLARLRALPTLVDQTIALLDRGLAAGVTPSRITLRDVPDQVRALLTDDPLQSALLKPFREIPASVPPDDRVRITRDALHVYQEQAAPAFRKLLQYLSETYVPRARTTIGIAALPNGADWYAYLVRRSTTTDLTPQQIHDLGLSEVKRIRAEMDKVMAATGFKGTFEEFSHFLRTDPRFFYDKAEDLVDAYRVIAKRADPELAHLFATLPRLPYGVTPVPDYEAKSQTTAYYDDGSPAAGRPGTYFVNTYDLKSRPKWEMEALTLHEAVPGHHLQISLAQELQNVPEWRKHNNYTAFVEGWGLYAESLGTEMGFYKDPYSKFGQLTYEMWRAIRLVVDTGLHAQGWTREQAIDYFKANAAKTEHDIEVEVDRYIVNPGQAVAYKIGELKIKELRAYAEKELGPAFDIRAFHDQVLGHGAVPLDVLEKNVKEWVAGRKR
jgi:uncharacterized protein (DUF885 family)